MIKPWALSTLIAFSAVNAFAWGPSFGPDEVASSSQFGSSYFLQTLSITEHLDPHPEDPNTYFVERPEKPPRQRTPEEEQREIQKSRDSLEFSWMLGYAYYHSGAQPAATGTTVYDDAHAFTGGIMFGLSRRMTVSVSGTYQALPVDSYNQGMGELALEYTIPLHSDGGVDAEKLSDAEAYYVAKYQESEREHIPAGLRYPNLHVGFFAGYYKNTKDAMNLPRGSETATSTGITMNENSLGPDLTLNLNPILHFRLKATFNSYSTDITQFLGHTVIGGTRPKSNLAVADMEGTTPLLMVYPISTVTASTGLSLGEKVMGRFGITYSKFDPTSTTGAGTVLDTISLGGIVDFYLNRTWKLGGSLDVTNGGNGYHEAVGGINFGYAL